MSGVIYKITFTGSKSGRCYIGSTIRFAERMSHHKWLMRAGKHHSIAMQRAAEKYGISAFNVEILETAPRDILIAREQHWMNVFSGHLYNCSPFAVPMLGIKKTLEQKERSASFHRGRKRSPETKALLSARMKSNWRQNPFRYPPTSDFNRDADMALSYTKCGSYHEVGAEFGVTMNAAYAAVKRVRQRLQSGLQAASRVYENLPMPPARLHPDFINMTR